MKALVTGGAGFLGSHLVERLVGLGWEVLVFDNFSTGKDSNLRYVKSKIRFVGNYSSFSNLPDVDVVFHLAATNLVTSTVDPVLDLNVNAGETVKLLIALSEMKCKPVLVFASSGSVYGEPVFSPQTEDHPLNPTSPYGISKLAAEKYVGYFAREYGLKTVVLRYYNIVGPRQRFSDDGGVVPIFVRRLLEGKPLVIEGDGLQERVFTDVRDVVDATVRAALCSGAYGGVFNIASDESITISELAHTVRCFRGDGVGVEYAPARVGDIHSFNPSVELAKHVLGFKPRFRLKDSLASVMEWMQCELGL